MCEENHIYWEIITSVVNGEATPEEQQKLDEWMACSEENRRLFEKVRRTMEGITPQHPVPEFDSMAGWDRFLKNIPQERKQRNLRPVWWSAVGCAAAIALFLLVTPYFSETPVTAPEEIQPGSSKAILVVDNQSPIHIGNQSLQLSSGGSKIENDSLSGLSFQSTDEEDAAEITYSKLIIPLGGEYKLTLADGTQVWLNSESEIRFPSAFTGDKREVEFSGEAYFKVATDSTRPFYVKTNDISVKVYGTEFNVRAYHEDPCIATTLVEGRVSVIPAGEEKREVKIEPSQQLTYSKAGQQIEIREVDVNLYTSWKTGYYTFENTSLKEMFNYLRRWYIFDVTYQDKELENLTFTGEFQKDHPIEYGLELIRLTCEVDFNIDGHHIIVRKSK